MDIYMKSVIIAIKDEDILSKIRVSLFNEDIKYLFTSSSDEAARIAEDHEIAAAVIDVNLPLIKEQRLFEVLKDINTNMQFVFLFDENIPEIVDIYNSLHTCKFLYKKNINLDEVSKLIDDSLWAYNKLDNSKYSLLNSGNNENYLKRMHEMSDLLNEKLCGYQQVIRIYNDCASFIFSMPGDSIKNFSIFVDRVINDYIQLFMIREPDFDLYLSSLNDTFNKPEEKKYFKFLSNSNDFENSKKKNILLVIDMLTICFDLIFDSYRGKLELTSDKRNIFINAVYEVRNRKISQDDTNKNYINILNGNTVMKICNSLISDYSDSFQTVRNENIIQYKIIIKSNLSEKKNTGFHMGRNGD